MPYMRAGRNPVGSNRGLHQPKRDRCADCGKRGLGPVKVRSWTGSPMSYRDCRYCKKIWNVTTQSGYFAAIASTEVTKK